MTRVILKLPSIRGPLRWSTASSEFRVRVSTALRALSPLEIVFALHPRDAAHGMVGTSRPRKVKIFSRPTSLYCATSCNRHGKQKSALVEPQCFPPLRLST